MQSSLKMIVSDAELRNCFVRIIIMFFPVVRNYIELWISLAFITCRIAVHLHDAEKSEAYIRKSDSKSSLIYLFNLNIKLWKPKKETPVEVASSNNS